MQTFLGKLSIAEALGDMYGNMVKALSAFTCIVYAVGTVAAQFTVLNIILSDVFSITSPYVIISCIIIIWYSTLGGIKSVTMTDIVQCFTFCLVIPLTAFFIWKSFDNGAGAILSTFEAAPIFDYKQILSTDNPKLFSALLLMVLYLIPGMDPTLFQRISMAKSIKQSMKSFVIASVILGISYAIMSFIGVLLFAGSIDDLDPNNVERYILNKYLPANFKGFFCVGIMAMAMSTADSYINTAAILSNDLRKALRIRVKEKNELFTVRIFAVLTGVLSLGLGLFFENLYYLLIAFANFYMSVTTVPMIVSIFGFRSTGMPILLGMITGFSVISVIELFTNIEYGVFVAMLGNFLVIIGSHYILRQPGGWVGIVDNGTFLAIQEERKQRRANFLENFKSVDYLTTDIKPESTYVFFGGFVIVSHFFSLYSLPKTLVVSNELLIDVLSYVLLSLSMILISFPVWREKFNNVLFRNSIFYMLFAALILESCILVLINNFGCLQIVIFTLSLLLAAILLRWYQALLLILFTIFCANFFY